MFKSADLQNFAVVLQILTSVIYDIVSHSWTVASITAKYYLVAAAAFIYMKGEPGFEAFSEKILDDSRFVVSSFVLAGTVLYLSGITLKPLIPIFSELTALVYLGYLFWEY